MELCSEYGIPHSEFQSWDEYDQDKAIALRLVQNDECPRCGTSRLMWKENRIAMVPEVGICRGCELKELAQEEIEQGQHHGRFVYLREPDKRQH